MCNVGSRATVKCIAEKDRRTSYLLRLKTAGNIEAKCGVTLADQYLAAVKYH